MSGEAVAVIIVLSLISLPIFLLVLWLRARSRLKKCSAESKKLEERFSSVIDVEKEVAAVQDEKLKVEQSIQELRSSYAEKKKVYDGLVKEVAIYDEKIALAQLGVYSPHFDFTDSDQFKAHIETVRAEQKAMVSAKTAIKAHTDWEVGGSKREGKKMADRAVRLSLRAFNNECDAALSNVRWNNVNTMEKRIQRAFEQINKLNETLNIEINPTHYQLKLKELWLTHEYREKQKEERDYKAEMNRLKREEERLMKDAAAAEKEEARYQKLLEKAKAEAAQAVGVDADQYEAQIAALTKELDAAHAKAERARSMAEQTRAGHIYVISNIGSFGDGVYKVGMTRRLEPMDRVRELGDASVPFRFDTHAMIYCEDAPSVEKALHSTFEKNRVNWANGRKEFFKVSLDKIEAEIRKIDPDADFITGVEAQEYFETLAMIKAENQAVMEAPTEFPSAI